MSIFNFNSLKMKRKRGIIPRDIWNRMIGVLESSAIVHVEGGRLQRTTKGTSLIIPRVASGGGSAVECVLGDLIAEPKEVGADQLYSLRPGYVTGGGASIFLEATGILPVDGEHLYMEILWTGVAEDGILLEGGTMTAAEIKQAAAIPLDVKPDIGALGGKHYVPLGNWVDLAGVLEWQKAGCGGVVLAFCVGGFKSVRNGDA